MEMTDGAGRDGGQVLPEGADPLTRQLLRQMVTGCTRSAESGLLGDGEGPAGGLDSTTVMELVSFWHRRGIEVGFPELMARPTPGRSRPLLSRRNTANAA
ncbi:hypothetical protein [Streptomyces sp. GC420]|uniref:hypothetical protein n=1 Tax=Streptomyces sp. GC420 TaxID=2697568 RepID=UPI00141503DC|nr:hypothetical protein [Streptomyces sp. GC420]NBM20880.1 hypothetical protein [Streptomyces sp. GC420]